MLLAVIYLIFLVNTSAFFCNNNLINPILQESFATFISVKQTFLCSEVPKSYGLLTGINDIGTSSYYTENLDINDAAEFLRNKTFIYETALLCFDGKQSQAKIHLKEISIVAGTYVSSNELCDREAIMEGLDFLVSTKGTFAFVLGGKNTGKTFVLKRLKEKNKQPIIYVNLRGDSNLLLNFVRSLQTMSGSTAVKAFFEKNVPELENIAKSQKIVVQLPSGEAVKSLASVNNGPYFLELLSRVTDLYPYQDLTLIVDEANLAFNSDKLTDAGNLKNIREILQVLIRFTKEERKINVVFVASDHSFPYQFNDPIFDCNLLEICTIIYIGDVPPKDMFELLTTKWGVHERLAIALISLFGGNIFQLHRALTNIHFTGGTPTYTIDSACFSSVDKCLSWHGDQARMQKTLRLLAETGFAPLDGFQDLIGEVISSNNVGGIVAADGLNTGVSQELMGDATFGLVVSRQCMRLAIAKRLHEMQRQADNII